MSGAEYEVLDVSMRRGTWDEAIYAAGVSLDDIIGWFILEGDHSSEQVRERVEDAIERAMADKVAES